MNDNIVNVEPMDMEKKNSEQVDSLSGEKTIIFGEEKDKCYWNDQEFVEGDMVCDNGVAYKCHMGIWLKEKEGC